MRKVPCECHGEVGGNGTHTTTTSVGSWENAFWPEPESDKFIDRVEEEDERKFVQSFGVISSWSSLNSFNGVPDMSLHWCDTLVDG